MRFLLTTVDDGTPQDGLTDEIQAKMGAFIAEMSRSGELLATGGLDPRATHIVAKDGKAEIVDGPFSESKEFVAGFALIEVRSEEEAIEHSRRFWSIVGSGRGIIQRVFGPEDMAGQ
ncbi:YciI family protein [Actinomadura oligospora]|uniref:YciI family protein n=1 Tax=Actinomadura oligospora TaxID=111804 RepID=UPI00047A8A4B|nr:YciI family protein [Actinomadura oligospora]